MAAPRPAVAAGGRSPLSDLTAAESDDDLADWADIADERFNQPSIAEYRGAIKSSRPASNSGAPTPEEEFTPSTPDEKGPGQLGTATTPVTSSAFTSLQSSSTSAQSSGSKFWKRKNCLLLGAFFRALATCPGLVACLSLAIFGGLAGVSLVYIPVQLDRGFDLLAESYVDAAIFQGAFVAAVEVNSRTSQRFSSGTSGNSTTYRVLGIQLLYELKDPGLPDGILTSTALREIAMFEKDLRLLPGWRATCALAEEQDRGFCDPGISLVNYALPTWNINHGKVLPESLNVDALSEKPLPLQAVLHVIERRNLTGLLLPADFIHGGGHPRHAPTTLRSAFRFKLPCGNGSTEDTEATKLRLQDNWERFLVKSLLPTLQAVRRDERALFRVHYEGGDLRALEYAQVLARCAALAAGASVFVFLSLLLQTRSILLSSCSVAVIALSLPLAYALFALVSGSTHLGTLCLLSVLISMGFGTDAAFVYTKTWRESARCQSCDADRLAWTYWHAGRATLATMTLTALSFFANLGSVLRPLREFGAFTGCCMVVTWLLLSLLYVPLCLLGDRHCAACRLHAPAREAAAGSGREEQQDTRQGAQAVDALLPVLQRQRCSACTLPVLAMVACTYVGFWRTKPATAAPSVMVEGHHSSHGQRLAGRFVDAGYMFSASFALPPAVEEVCSEQFFAAGSLSRCSFFWCEADFNRYQHANGSCSCHRRQRSGCAREANATVVQRLVGLHPAYSMNLTETAGDFLDAELAVGLTPRSGDVLGSMTSGSLAPLLLYEWGTGKSLMAPMTQVTMVLPRQNPDNSSCGWDDLCFCGSSACQLPENSWWQVPRPFHLPPQPAPAPLQSWWWRAPLKQHATVDVVLGLHVTRTMPFLRRPDWASSWSFLETFDMRQPEAQRDLHGICSMLPDDLHVVERRCWMDDFQRFLRGRGAHFPVPAARFGGLFADFVRSGRTGLGSGDQHFWLEGGELRACSVSFVLDLPMAATKPDMLEYRKNWDAYLRKFNSAASLHAFGAFHTSELWVQAEVQGALVFSAVLTVGLVVVMSSFSVLIFTYSLTLPAFVLLAALGSAGELAFFMTVIMGWTLGPIEVIILVVSLGHAFHCALQIACAYSSREALSGKPLDLELQSHPAVRLQRVAFALKSTSGLLLGSAATTAISISILACSQLTLFRKIGAAIPVLALLSVFNALLPLPAGLLMCGPVSPGDECRTSPLEACRQLRGLWRCCLCRCRAYVGAARGGGAGGDGGGDRAVAEPDSRQGLDAVVETENQVTMFVRERLPPLPGPMVPETPFAEEIVAEEGDVVTLQGEPVIVRGAFSPRGLSKVIGSGSPRASPGAEAGAGGEPQHEGLLWQHYEADGGPGVALRGAGEGRLPDRGPTREGELPASTGLPGLPLCLQAGQGERAWPSV